MNLGLVPFDLLLEIEDQVPVTGCWYTHDQLNN
jgi:hypothetical protein